MGGKSLTRTIFLPRFHDLNGNELASLRSAKQAEGTRRVPAGLETPLRPPDFERLGEHNECA